MILFTSLIFFPHLSAVRLNMWTEITLFADMFTRGFLLFLFSLALQREKYDVGEEGDDIDVSFDYILFFSFSNICAFQSSESFDPGSKQGCCFAQPVRFLPSMEIRVTRKYFPASRPGVRSVANKIKQSRLRVTF